MRKLLAYTSFLFITDSLTAQQNTPDTATVPGIVKHVYLTQRNKDLPLYNGIQYVPEPFRIEGIPFIVSEEWQKGYVVYDDVLYENILMKYDQSKDQLVITPDMQGGMFIVLFSPRVKEFSFDGYKFVNMADGMPEKGYYQQLVSGKVDVFARKTKYINEKIEPTGITRTYIEKTRYYILKDGKYNTIKNKNDLLSVLRESRPAIEEALKQKNLRYRDAPEQNITTAAELYNKAN